MTERPNGFGCHPLTALLTGLAVVAAGTAILDASRLWLLVVPLSFLLAAMGTAKAITTVIRHTDSSAPCHSIAQVSIELGIGLACLAFATFVSALAGIVWLAGFVASGMALYGLWRLIAGPHVSPTRESLLPSVATGTFVGLSWLLTWLWATIPPVFYDELAYHLVIPQRALTTGRLEALPWLYYTYMPHASDLLLAWGLWWGDAIGARAGHVAVWMIATLAAWGLAESVARPQNARWAGFAVMAALAISPTLWFLSTLTFAEAALTAALLCAACLLVTSHDTPRPWLAFGLLLGFVAGVKLSGIAWMVAALLAAGALGWRRRDVGLSAAVAGLCGLPWWLRAWWLTGNPVFPMGYRVLGGRQWSDFSETRLRGDLPAGLGDLGLGGLLRLPLDLVIHPEQFGSASDVGLPAVAAVGLLLLLPLFVRATSPAERARRLATAAGLFASISILAWLVTSTTARFLAPLFALGLVSLAALAVNFSLPLRTIACACLLLAGGWGAWRFVGEQESVFASTAVALGRETPEAYAVQRLDHYAAARFVREHTATDAKLLLIGEARAYYFGREALAPYPYVEHPMGGWIREAATPEALAARVAAEGFTHVVLNVREFARLRDKYGILAFSGPDDALLDQRLKEFPRALDTLFTQHGVYVFAIPAHATASSPPGQTH